MFPPTVEELVPADHPARFVGAFVDALDRGAWGELGIALDGAVRGAAGYHPGVLLGVWLYGFMTGVRSSRKLETACRDQMPYLWLTGWQRPDHTTLWRFYQAHREGMRTLLKRTVRTAVRAGLVDLAVQAVDGTKLGGNAAKARTYDQAGLERLLARTEAAITDLEAQNSGGDEPPPPRLPERLAEQTTLLQQVQEALATVTAEDGPTRINLTDPDAVLVKSRQGYQAGYNGQAQVAGLDPTVAGHPGLLITAADLVATASDHGQLLPLRDQSVEHTGVAPAVQLADGGYHAVETLVGCAERGQVVVMPEAQQARLESPYHKDAFVYDAEADTFTCPEGQTLRFGSLKLYRDQPERLPSRVYRGAPATCRACPAFGACTTNQRHGRTLEIGPDDATLRRHRAWMTTPDARTAYRRRKSLPEPVFGILKEHQAARRLLLRGLAHVRAEWTLLATAFNLRTLARCWQAGTLPPHLLARAALG
jgi:transposase